MGASCSMIGTAGRLPFRLAEVGELGENEVDGDDENTEVGEEDMWARKVRGDVGEVASVDRNVRAAGDTFGLSIIDGLRALRPGSRLGSRGKRR